MRQINNKTTASAPETRKVVNQSNRAERLRQYAKENRDRAAGKRTNPAEKPTAQDVRKLDSAVKSLLAITENQKRDLAAGKAQFGKLQAQAAQLAKALREAIQALDPVKRQWTIANAQQALAAYEEGK